MSSSRVTSSTPTNTERRNAAQLTDDLPRRAAGVDVLVASGVHGGEAGPYEGVQDSVARVGPHRGVAR